MKTSLTVLTAAFVVGLAGAAHAQNLSPSPNGNLPPFGGGRDVGGGPPPYAGPTYGGTAVPRPGGTVEYYGPNGSDIIAVPHNCSGCATDFYRIR